MSDQIAGVQRKSSATIARSFRYAAPSTGAHRFADPVYSATSTAVMEDEAPRAALAPLQEPGDPDHPICLGRRAMTDDVLFVNVWSPTPTAGEPRPVAVFIHGGNLIHGAAGWPVYDGAELSEALDIVVVTIGYRLGVWGWDTEMPWSPRTASGGLKDQAAALKWVVEHALELGGDPDRITLMGHSVGATCALAHVYSGVRGLRRLMLFSPPLDPLRHEERVGFAESFIAADPTASALGHDPARAENTELLEFQNALEAAWRETDSSDDLLGFFRPAWTAGEEYPWENGTAPDADVPILSTWTEGEFGPDGPGHRERLERLLASHANSEDMHTVLTSSEFDGISAADTHFLLIPLVFGNHAAWEGTTLFGLFDDPLYLAKQAGLRESLAAFIRS